MGVVNKCKKGKYGTVKPYIIRVVVDREPMQD
jgi:hypothetical protein